MAIQLTRRRFTVDKYHRMAAAGILNEDDRVELIEGEIIDLAPIGVRHAHCAAQLTTLLIEKLGREVLVWSQNPVRLETDTEVQPDIAILRLRDYSNDKHAPGPADIRLVVEVAEATLTSDRKIKLPLYARARIPEFWLINLKEGNIEIYSRPSGDTYSDIRRVGRDEALPIPGFPAAMIPVDEILR